MFLRYGAIIRNGANIRNSTPPEQPGSPMPSSDRPATSSHRLSATRHPLPARSGSRNSTAPHQLPGMPNKRFPGAARPQGAASRLGYPPRVKSISQCSAHPAHLCPAAARPQGAASSAGCRPPPALLGCLQGSTAPRPLHNEQGEVGVGVEFGFGIRMDSVCAHQPSHCRSCTPP